MFSPFASSDMVITVRLKSRHCDRNQVFGRTLHGYHRHSQNAFCAGGAQGACAMTPPLQVAVVGAGPAGLMAAERLASAGLQVDLYDAMPSVGRKFLLAGKG